ncbi:hypothetical protein SteCoe_13643 [Stentor coeruleus]|uniref:Uncharacterized protein n=1 Tax=Stentor coeruleus TaxID=5963 RepID=A0A1R2C844_9CILI|nr:hypothetical protein SteCoe_13643 [Stentor coeruleus]
MFKRLAPVIELPESRSDSASPVHKRSQTMHKSRIPTSPEDASSQVWMIIQSRRNLDKKIRNIQRKSKGSREKTRPSPGPTIESPRDKSIKDVYDVKNNSFTLNKKRNELQNMNRLKKERNKEIKDKITEKTLKARNDIKQQSLLDLEYIKKREEIISQQKKDKVNSIKNSLNNAKHKRVISNKVLKEINSIDYQNKLKKVSEFNKIAENSLKILEQKQDIILERINSCSELKENISRVMPERSYSSILSPRRSKF